MRASSRDAAPPLATSDEAEALKSIVPRWFSWYNAAFLFGAAFGGLVFGWLGDRLGRVRAMGASIFCFSLFSVVGYFAATPEQLLAIAVFAGDGRRRHVADGRVAGVGSLVRGVAADGRRNAGHVGQCGARDAQWARLSSIDVEPTSWRWTLLVCASPMALAFVVWLWRAGVTPLAGGQGKSALPRQGGVSMATVFRPPLLRLTLIGIAVGTIPLLGGWGATQWFIPWADKVGGAADPTCQSSDRNDALRRRSRSAA